MGRDDSKHLTIEAVDERALGLAQAPRILHQRLEDRLDDSVHNPLAGASNRTPENTRI